VRLLFVCMGNICRSPTAEAIMRDLVRAAGLQSTVEIDSAGTGGWHVGDPPDPRSRAEGARRGVAVGGAARQVTARDFQAFDLLLAMDAANRRDLLRVTPAGARAEVRLLREFDPTAVAAGDLDVPDPYYGGGDGFALVFDVVERACHGLLEHVRTRLAA
jgi:protein-tyrosine phosphatase